MTESQLFDYSHIANLLRSPLWGRQPSQPASDMMMPPSVQIQWKVVAGRSTLVKWGLISLFIGALFSVSVGYEISHLARTTAVVVISACVVGIFLFFTAFENLVLRCFNQPPDTAEDGAEVVAVVPTSGGESRDAAAAVQVLSRIADIIKASSVPLDGSSPSPVTTSNTHVPSSRTQSTSKAAGKKKTSSSKSSQRSPPREEEMY
jgi:hypothetical protein